MARPHKEIDQKDFEKLCGLQCTKAEICGFLEVSDKTLDAWIKRTYGKHASFSVVFKQKRTAGLVSLRRNQFNLSKHNATIAIWLGRQYLHQTDEGTLEEEEEEKDSDGFMEAMSKEAEKAWGDGE